MDWKTCDRCARKYPSDAAYKKLCAPCWKRQHGIDLHPTDLALDVTLTRVEVLESKVDQLTARVAQLTTRVAHLVAKLQRPVPPPPPPVTFSIPEDRLRVLISLCHPDRHGGSDRSNEATKWLLSQRNKDS